MKAKYITPALQILAIKVSNVIATSVTSLSGTDGLSRGSDWTSGSANAKERHEEDFGDSHTGWTDGLW